MTRYYGGHNQGGDHFGAEREAKLIEARERQSTSRSVKLAALEREVLDTAMGAYEGAVPLPQSLLEACAALAEARKARP